MYPVGYIDGEQSIGIRFKTTLTLVGHSQRCVIPKPICEALGLKEGDVLTVELEGDKIVLSRRTKR